MTMPNRKIIILAVAIAIILIVAGIIYWGRKPTLQDEVTIEVWGVFDDSDIYNKLEKKLQESHSHINIDYYKKSFATYEDDILNAMATNRGPDVFMISNNWVPRYLDRIQEAPSEIINLKRMQDEFVDVVYFDFVFNGKIVALPLGVDTLALYYNKDIFNTAGIAQPPVTWEEFIDMVEKTTILDEQGNIIRAGAALGTARNINRSTDILSLLMFHSGSSIFDPAKGMAVFDRSISLGGEMFYPGERALRFYTDFANPLKSVYTWNRNMDYSIDAFYKGDAAMMINYSYHLPTIRAKSPYLNFDIAPLPQAEGAESKINYANYWGMAVSANSRKREASWKFINWLASAEGAESYLALAKRPTARRDLIAIQEDDPDIGVFAKQALTARSWYQVDNLSIERILADMIESVIIGKATIKEAVGRAADKITALGK